MLPEHTRVDRTASAVIDSFEEADRQDRHYWWAQSPHDRLRAMAHLRRLNYGDLANGPVQRVFEVVQSDWR